MRAFMHFAEPYTCGAGHVRSSADSKIGAGAGRPKAPGVAGFGWWPRAAVRRRVEG
jgi:hypothetical protein